MFTIRNQFRYIPMETLVENYRSPAHFYRFCTQCTSYHQSWSCPPSGFDHDRFLKGYPHVILAAVQVIYSETLRRDYSTDSDEYLELFTENRHLADQALLAAEKAQPDATSLFAGCCMLCQHCSREEELPCRHSLVMRISLDTFGFDIVKIARELFQIEIQWAEKKLPAYQVLVSALLIPEKGGPYLKIIEKELEKQFAAHFRDHLES